MIGEDRSLLSFLDAPVVVGDPDGLCIHVNPAFESRFGVAAGPATSVPLGELFAGGAREAVLRAVARVVEGGESVRFPVREAGVGWSAVASPIVADGDRVGVVILFKEEVVGTERLLAVQREIHEPIEEIDAVLQGLLEQTGGRRAQRHRNELEEALRALARLRKWIDELAAILEGDETAGGARWRPARVLRHVAGALRGESGKPLLTLLVPAELPEASGDAIKLEALLVRWIRERLESAPVPETVTLGARSVGRAAARVVLVSLTERGPGGNTLPVELPALLRQAVASSDGRVHTACDPLLGRVTLLRFPAPDAAS